MIIFFLLTLLLLDTLSFKTALVHAHQLEKNLQKRDLNLNANLNAIRYVYIPERVKRNYEKRQFPISVCAHGDANFEVSDSTDKTNDNVNTVRKNNHRTHEFQDYMHQRIDLKTCMGEPEFGWKEEIRLRFMWFEYRSGFQIFERVGSCEGLEPGRRVNHIIGRIVY
ncbi:916_t:CDS:2 [Dentiscutata erythropus]|uniref:916_t:CDS:1 n=1 Tax=Dentiscutata erythropus TaxID=1348616 RepID=A0A9N9AN17_9GLOM|nr:916_t:CDS:2 [Dentiscutata erythropus]